MKNARPMVASLFRTVVVGASVVMAVSMQAALFPQGFVDHTLCCGAGGMVGLDGSPIGSGGAVSFAADTMNTASGTSASPDRPAAAASSTAASTEPSTSPEVVDGYLKLDFDRLAFFKFTAPAYDPATKPDAPVPTVADQIPASVKSYDGKKAIVTGFMLPVKMENGLVQEFLLVRNPMMCCYGVTPQMNEWIVVKMVKGGVHPLMDVPVSFYGQLRVKEMFENGYMTGIYLLEGEKMGDVKD